MSLRTSAPGQLAVLGPAGITWQEFTWGELLDGLKKDLYLDSSSFDITGIRAGGALAGSYPNPTLATIPWATLSFSANVTTNASSGVPVWTALGSVFGGMTATSSGIKVPKTGLYAFAAMVRVDTTTTGNSQCYLTVNGAQAGMPDLEIGTSTHTSSLQQIISLSTNDVVSLQFSTGAAGTWYGTGVWGNLLQGWFVSN